MHPFPLSARPFDLIAGQNTNNDGDADVAASDQSHGSFQALSCQWVIFLPDYTKNETRLNNHFFTKHLFFNRSLIYWNFDLDFILCAYLPNIKSELTKTLVGLLLLPGNGGLLTNSYPEGFACWWWRVGVFACWLWGVWEEEDEEELQLFEACLCSWAAALGCGTGCGGISQILLGVLTSLSPVAARSTKVYWVNLTAQCLKFPIAQISIFFQ